MTDATQKTAGAHRTQRAACEVSEVKKKRLSGSVCESIAHKIYTDEWHAGQKLPAERALAAALGVSRTVLREALADLARSGYIGRDDTKGWVVLPLSLENALSPINEAVDVFTPDLETMRGLMDLRMLLETYTVDIAARNENTEELLRAQRAIDGMREHFLRGTICYDCEVVFHSALVRMTGNKALINVFNLCKNLLHKANKMSLYVAQKTGTRISAMDEHQRILDAIASHDPQAAVAAMREHLELSRDNMIAAYQYILQETQTEDGQTTDFKEENA